MIDSSKFSVIETGLKVTQGKSIVNSIRYKSDICDCYVYMHVERALCEM